MKKTYVLELKSHHYGNRLIVYRSPTTNTKWGALQAIQKRYCIDYENYNEVTIRGTYEFCERGDRENMPRM